MRRQTTKELLGESFRELAKRKPINKITIASITNNCGMTQPTFYNHFRDKYDLMTWLYVSDTKNIMGQIGKDGYQWRDTLLDGMRYCAEHKGELLNAFTYTSGREAFLGYMMQVNVDLLGTEVRKKLMTENIPEDILLMEYLKYDLSVSSDKEGRAMMQEVIAIAAKEDYSSYDVLKDYMQDEDEDAKWMEGQLALIECIGLQNWLVQQL